MKQSTKFYLASFLKNQTYFVPILVIFFQDLGLDYSQIFWVMTGGAIFSFVIEIPTGVFADLYGKRRSLIISKGVIALSFLAFGLAQGFWTLLAANLIYVMGKSFRSGTETAYAYDYLASDQDGPGYTRVKAGQKFYARLSESIAAAVGGFLAVHLGFSAVFFVAAVPAAANFIQTLTWPSIQEHDGEKGIGESLAFVRRTLRTIWKTAGLPTVILNVLIFESVLVALATFVQPYMKEAGLAIEKFGLVYSGFLIVAAFLTRFSSDLEERFGGRRTMNFLTLLAAVPLFVLGAGHVSVVGVGLFFLVLLVANIRSPISNTIFHDRVESDNRATAGSVLELFKTAGQIALLPLMGYLADLYSIFTAIMVLAVLVFLAGAAFYVRPGGRQRVQPVRAGG